MLCLPKFVFVPHHMKHHQYLHVFCTRLTWIAQNSVRPIELKYITVATILHGELVHILILVAVGSQNDSILGTWTSMLMCGVPHLPFSIIFLACVNGPDKNIVLQKRRSALSVFRMQTPLRESCVYNTVNGLLHIMQLVL